MEIDPILLWTIFLSKVVRESILSKQKCLKFYFCWFSHRLIRTEIKYKLYKRSSNYNTQMSIIQRFFTQPPFLIKKIIKPQNVINEVSPNLYENLRDSSKQFIKALLNKDGDFIRQVTARSLGDRLIEDLENYRDQDLIQNFHLGKYHFESSEVFEISPYVLFGEEFNTRVQSSKLWEDMRPLSSNRFIKFNPNLSIMQRFKQYQKKQIFGFHCIYEPLLVDVADSERNAFIKPLMITFETDSVNIDPFIVDCQGSLFEDWKASGFR